jgi:hypothetical protein
VLIDPVDFGAWSTHRLTYDHHASCWSLETYIDRHTGTPDECHRNPDLSSPADVHAAQQWAASELTRNRAHTIGVGWDLSTWTVTEWQPIDVGGRMIPAP